MERQESEQAAWGEDEAIRVAGLEVELTAFSDFNRDNDPHGEHDLGLFDHDGERILWKIDAHDLAMLYGSPDATDVHMVRPGGTKHTASNDAIAPALVDRNAVPAPRPEVCAGSAAAELPSSGQRQSGVRPHERVGAPRHRRRVSG